MSTCSNIPNYLGSLLKKRIFDPFCYQSSPLSRHFGIFHGPKRVTTVTSKRGTNSYLGIPGGLGTTQEKTFFFAPGFPIDPPLAPTMRGPGGPLVPRSDGWYGGLGVPLGDSEGWKPQKMGACRWIRCPRNLVLRQIAQDPARSRFWGLLTQTLHMLGQFWAISQTYRGVRGQEKALSHGAIKVHVERSTVQAFFLDAKS